MSKRILSFLLALVMVAGLVPVTALTAFAAVEDTSAAINGTYEGGWSVNKETATVTLKSLKITATGYTPLELGNVQELVLQGDNTITVPNGMYGVDGIDIDNFFSNYTLKISGSGSLTIKATGIGIDAFSENIQIESGTVIITSWSEGIDCSKLTMNGGRLSVHAEDDGSDNWGYGAISCNSFVMNGGTADVSSTYYSGIECQDFTMYGGSLSVWGKRDGIDSVLGDAITIDGGTADIRSLAGVADDGKYGAIGSGWDFGPEVCFSVSSTPDGFGELYDCLKGSNYYDHIKTTSSSSVRAFDFASVSPAVTNAELNAGKKNLGEMTLGSDATDIDFAAFPDNQGLSGNRSIRVYRDGTLFYSEDYESADTSVWNLKDNITEPGKYKVGLMVYAPCGSYYAHRSIVFEMNIKGNAFTTQPAGGEVKAGEKLTVNWKTDFTPVKQQLMGYTDDSTKTVIRDLTTSATSTAVDTAYEKGYCIRAYYSADEYVDSNRFYVTEAKSFTTQPKGGNSILDDGLKITWSLNFQPVKQVVYGVRQNSSQVVKMMDLSASVTSAVVVPNSNFSGYFVRAYYSDAEFINSDVITIITKAPYTANSTFTPGGTMTVDIERIAEYCEIWMADYLDEAITYKWYRNGTAISGATGQSYKLTSADLGKEIYAVIVGSGTLTTPTVTIKDTTLAAPTLKASNVASTGKIKLTWNKVDGAVKYQIVRSLDNKNWEHLTYSTGTSATNSKTDAGKTYYYKIRAIDADGNKSAYSNVVSRMCDLPQPVVTVSNVASTGKIKLTWEKVEGATKYEIYRATSKDGTYTKLSTVTGTSATNTKTDAGTTYYYKVKAIHSNSSANSAYSAVVSRTCDLPQPTVTVSNVASTGKIKLSWDKIDGATSYVIYRATSKDGTYSKLSTVTGTSATNTKTDAGKTYYYKVRAIHSNSSANSAYSSIVTRTCDLPQPTAKVELNSKGKPVISWGKVEGAVKYTVYIYDANGNLLKTSSTTSLKLTHGSAVAGTTYKYRVVAVYSNTSANSAKSITVSIKSK